jgi:type IV pilus assembly protein PilM
VFKRRSAKPTALVGLDLDPSHIAAAEVHVNGSLAVTRGAVAPLRPGILRDGEVTDPEALTEALRAFFAEHDLPTRVRLGIANQRIVVRSLDLPPLDDPKALDAAVRAAAPDHVPMPMDEAVLDFQPLGLVESPGGPRLRVVIVAVRRELVERLAAAARAAGLRPEGIDLAAFAMVRAVRHDSDGAALYVNVAGLTNVAVANRDGCLFTRAAPGGLQGLATTLAERRALTLEHAAQWLVHVGLAAPLDELEGEPDLLASARGVLEEGVHELADTVRNSLNFYRMQEAAQTVDRGVLCGPAVAVTGFAERLGELLALPVEPAVVAAASPDVLREGDAHRLAVAAGLAVESRP